MPVLYVILIVLAALLVPLAVMLFATMPIARRQYENQFVRASKEKWARENSCPSNSEHTAMYDTGLMWAKRNASRMKPVSIENDGLRLVGELFDFGSQKSVIILSGRAEALEYSYYFAEPYERLGFNVLVIDGRAHGESEGMYSCVGVTETNDVELWARLLCERYGSREVMLHGLCIGSSTAIFLAARSLPFISRIVVEGPYTDFYSVLKARIRAANRPVFPVALEMSLLLYLSTGVNIFTETPLKYIKRVKTPVLFICGRQDISSLPKNAERLYAACASDKKQIVWFERGAHSHLRITDPPRYDAAVMNFVKKYDGEEK